MLRIFVGYTRVSLINVIVTLSLFFLYNNHLANYVLGVVAALLVLKLAEIAISNKLISIRESRRTSKGWDGLPTSIGNYPELLRNWY